MVFAKRLSVLAILAVMFLATPTLALACGCHKPPTPTVVPTQAPIVQSAPATVAATEVSALEPPIVNWQRSPSYATVAGWHKIDLGDDAYQKYVVSGFEAPDHDPNALPCQIGDFTDWTGLYQLVGQDNSVKVTGLVSGIDLEMYIGVEMGNAHDWWDESVNGHHVTSNRPDVGPEWIYYEKIPGSWITGPEAIVTFHNKSDQLAGKARTYFIFYRQTEVA